MNGAHVSVFVTPPLNDYSPPNVFDHASPASSNGLEDDVHSHASSSSYRMHPPSPRPDISQTFQERLSFHSPAWVTGALPDERRSPPLHKPQSPPQLLIPDASSPGGVDAPPIINAPDGDGGLVGSGPTLQIVPATPVSGGAVTARNVPFQDMQQGMSSHYLAPFPISSPIVIKDPQPTLGRQRDRNGRTIISTARRAASLPISPTTSRTDHRTPRRSPTTAPSNRTSSSSAAVSSSCSRRPREQEACRTRPSDRRLCGTPCRRTSDRRGP